jgi:hypothetical protein
VRLHALQLCLHQEPQLLMILTAGSFILIIFTLLLCNCSGLLVDLLRLRDGSGILLISQLNGSC